MGKEPTTIKMEINILEIGSKTKRMAMESYNTPAEQFMMENGWTTKPPTKEKSFMPTRINMKALSSMEKSMGKVFTTTKLEENTKDNGSMIKSMATGSLTMPMGINTKETGGTDKE